MSRRVKCREGGSMDGGDEATVTTEEELDVGVDLREAKGEGQGLDVVGK